MREEGGGEELGEEGGGSEGVREEGGGMGLGEEGGGSGGGGRTLCYVNCLLHVCICIPTFRF